jgi:hypothetical protein
MEFTIKLGDLVNRPNISRDKEYPNFMIKMTDKEIRLWIKEATEIILIECPHLRVLNPDDVTIEIITEFGAKMIASLTDRQILFDILTIPHNELKNHHISYFEATRNAFIDYVMGGTEFYLSKEQKN